MRIAFRVDASSVMGIGHLRRCIALADRVRSLGAEVLIVTRDLGLDSAAQANDAGFQVTVLPAPSATDSAEAMRGDGPEHRAWAGVPQLLDAEQTCAALQRFEADWMVVDHYSFDAVWHEAVRTHANTQIAAIDDLADRRIEAALLVDQTLAGNHKIKHSRRGSTIRRLLGGPRFALLGAAYANRRGYEFRERVESIGIFVGGTDPWNASELALRACRSVSSFHGSVQVVTTSLNSHCDRLRAVCRNWPNTELLVDLPDLATFFSAHDLQIGAGGGAAWERCCMGAPTIVAVLADNHRSVAGGLGELGVAVVVPDPSVAALRRVIEALVGDPERRAALGSRARELVDGRGAWRVALALHADGVALRAATPADGEMAYGWRNDVRTRAFFRNTDSVDYRTHIEWWRRTLADPNRRLLIAMCGSEAVGSLRLDLDGQHAELSLYVNPEATGLGLGPAMLRAAQHWIVENERGVAELQAEVLSANRASGAAFEAASFTLEDTGLWVWRAGR